MFEQIILWVPRVSAAILVFLAFYFGAKAVRGLIARAATKIELVPTVAGLLAKSAQGTLVIIGAITALGTMGVDVSALVAGLGLTGFALGFAIKDSISNLLAGVLILIYQPFCINDRIRVIGFEGEVVEIDLRYTTLQGEHDKVLIPNSSMFTNPIVLL